MASTNAVIFDLDDTLYPERAYAFSGFAAVASAFSDVLSDPSETTAQLTALFDTPDRPRVFDALLQARGLGSDPTLSGRMVEVYREHVPTIQLHPDADAVLTRVRGKYKLGIITDGRVSTQTLKLEALGLRQRVDRAIITSESGADFAKPHPLAFERMAEALGVKAEECVYVADNATKDFIAPNELGWLTVKIVRADGIYRNAPTAEEGQPRHVIESLDELDALLG